MRRSLLLGLFGLGLLAGLLPAQGNPEGVRVAIRIHNAQQTLSYRGNRIYYSNYEGKIRLQRESVAVRHDVQAGTRDLRLELLQVMFHTKEFPGQAVATTLYSRRQASTLAFRDFRIPNLALALKNYHFTQKRIEMVAGRACDLCVVTPKVPDRRSWMVWADSVTGLVLRADEYSADLKLLSVMVFEAKGLEYGPGTNFNDIGNWFVSGAVSKSFASVHQAENDFGRPAALPSYLPAGYTMHEIKTRDLGQGNLYLSLSYTDGVDTIMVVNGLTPMQKTGTATGLNQTPIISRYTSGSLVQVWVETDGYMAMVMGRLSADQIPLTLESILLNN